MRCGGTDMLTIQLTSLTLAAGWLCRAALLKWMSESPGTAGGGALASVSFPEAETLLIAFELFVGLTSLTVAMASVPSRSRSSSLASADRPLSKCLGTNKTRSRCLVGLAVLFGIFAIQSARRVLGDESSCGCYGHVTVPPLISFTATSALSVWCFAVSGLQSNVSGDSASAFGSVDKKVGWPVELSNRGWLLSSVSGLLFFLFGLSVPTALSHAAGSTDPLLRVSELNAEQRELLLKDLPQLSFGAISGNTEYLIVRDGCGQCDAEINHLWKAERNGASWSDLIIVSIGEAESTSTKVARIRQLTSLRGHIRMSDSPAANRLITPQRFCVAAGQIQPCRLVAGEDG